VRVIFIHQNFPGQFRHLLPFYPQRSDAEMMGIGERRWGKDNLAKLPKGFRVAAYGSRTAPVAEVIEDGHNGLLVDCCAPADIVLRIVEVCEHPDQVALLRLATRQTILERYDPQQICQPRQVALLEQAPVHTVNAVLTTAV